MKQDSGRNKWVSWVFSLLFAVNITVGREIYVNHGIDRFLGDKLFLARETAVTIVWMVLVCFVLEKLLPGIIGRCQSIVPGKKIRIKNKKAAFFALWAGIFAAWFPAFLAYYPGIFSYDSHTQTRMALGLMNITRFHPPLHTLIWKAFILLGDKTGISALVMYGLTQMLLFSLVMAYMLYTMMKEGPGRVFFVLCVIFVALNPVMAIMSMAMTKDVPFAMALLCLLVQIYKMVKDSPEFFSHRYNSFILIILSVLAGLLRNNMLYALVLSDVFFVLLKRKYRKEMLFISIVSVSAILMINGPVYTAMGIGPGYSRESLSVPFQQIARTAVNHELTEEEKSSIDRFLPYDELESLYNPRFADPVKAEFRSEYYDSQDSHKTEFIRLWLALLKKYPLDYINAFAELNIPFWYIGASSVDPVSQRMFIESGIYYRDYYPITRSSIAPPLVLKYYQAFATYGITAYIPPVSVFLSIALPIWLLLFCMTMFIRRQKSEYILCLLPYVFLWLTYMAGPVSIFRYIFPIYIAYPFLIFLLLADPAKDGREKA